MKLFRTRHLLKYFFIFSFICLVIIYLYISKGIFYSDIPSFDELTASIKWTPLHTDGSKELFGASIRSRSGKLNEIVIYDLRTQTFVETNFNESRTRCCVRYGRKTVVESQVKRYERSTGSEAGSTHTTSIFWCDLPIIYDDGNQLSQMPTHASFKYGQFECTDKDLPYVPSATLQKEIDIDENRQNNFSGFHFIPSYDMLAGSIDWKPRYTPLRGDDSVVLFGASIRNVSLGSKEIAIYGQWHKFLQYAYNSIGTHCCVKYGHNRIVELPVVRHIYRPYSGSTGYILASFMFVCALPIIHENRIPNLPAHASITFAGLDCTDKHHTYIPTFMILKSKPMTIGVTPKVAWGSLNSHFLIEWIEAVLYLGVDRILIYVDGSLNNETRRVINYYEDKGLCLVIPYNLPEVHQSKTEYPRTYGYITEQICHDYQMIMYDSLERLRGMTYYFLLDTDEFLIPSKNRSYKQMLIDFEQSINHDQMYNGYFFMTAAVPLNWDKNTSLTDLKIGQYHYRTEGYTMEEYHKKSIVLPEAVDHYFGGETPFMNNGYKHKAMLNINYTDAYTRHYRAMKHYLTMKRFLNLEMVEWGEKHIASRSRKVYDAVVNNNNKNNS